MEEKQKQKKTSSARSPMQDKLHILQDKLHILQNECY